MPALCRCVGPDVAAHEWPAAWPAVQFPCAIADGRDVAICRMNRSVVLSGLRVKCLREGKLHGTRLASCRAIGAAQSSCRQRTAAPGPVRGLWSLRHRRGPVLAALGTYCLAFAGQGRKVRFNLDADGLCICLRRRIATAGRGAG